ncbi:DUF4864 domain-containing protein [Histidinibacterium aquaticum]|uniref:DUF4864 domain-containing protein n=1 Tax=Histidinibacterium aquaticum TaxID=2613962 RepID=A0A5J5GKN2_9RHOB|nr:DUF4864 domain-containing protein [Histidinibacterium aquaticum]KAA9008188.1 DUF4864 domain-containing protein [Histidinibacterium aquaticum]
MIRTTAFALALLAFAGPAAAQNEAIEDVISRQLQAFNDRDVEEAFTFASPMIQGMFGNPDRFGMMVEQGYPMVWTNNSARFGELAERRGALYQKVILQDADGVVHVLEYRMIQTEDGWEIDGVSILPAPDLGV